MEVTGKLFPPPPPLYATVLANNWRQIPDADTKEKEPAKFLQNLEGKKLESLVTFGQCRADWHFSAGAAGG